MSHRPFAGSLWTAAAILYLLSVDPARSACGAVRFDAVGAPTEVINTGRSEVLGSLNLFARGTGNVTGTATGGAVQIGLVFFDPALQIDNTTTSGIRLFSSPGFAAASPSIVDLGNRDLGGRCVGFLTINLQPGAKPAEGDFLRIEGIRGRIDASDGVIPGTGLFVSLQSANDPSACSFSANQLRVATTFKGLKIEIVSTELNYEIQIAEGFARAFVDRDAGDDGNNRNDRVDSGGNPAGMPTNSTQLQIRLDGIPDGISDVVWPARSAFSAAGGRLMLLNRSFSASSAIAVYSYEAENQVGSSDIMVETFSLTPQFVFSGGRCSCDRLTASIALAPAVGTASDCLSPADAAMRPRFLESYELMIQRLSTSSAMTGSDGFTLQILGSGFQPDSKATWNGSPRDTTFVSSTELAVLIPAADLAKPGTAKVAIANPVSRGGGISNVLEFVVLPYPLTLVYPRLGNGTQAGAGGDDREYTGIALVNLSGRPAKLKLTAFDHRGAIISGLGIMNPATLQLNDAQQVALLAGEIFGPGLDSAAAVGWIKVEGNVPQVAGFFLAFDARLTRMDGADVSPAVLSSFVFPELQGGGVTNLHIANPNQDPTVVNIELIRADGSSGWPTISRNIEAGGILAVRVSDLFPFGSLDSSDYIRASASRQVAAFEYLKGTEQDTAGLNGQDELASATVLYCPQYVVGGSEWNTVLSIINRSQKPGQVSLRFIADDGVQAGPTKVLPVAAGGKLRISDQDFFVPAGNALRQGYLEISTDGIRISGSVVFANSGRKAFAAALPLIAELKDRVIFSHVASNATFFTGLAILNPDSWQALAIVQVFDRNGIVLASRSLIIPARARVSKLLTEYFPELGEREISSGYFTVKGMTNLAAFALFGTRDLTVLSAIPAQKW
jgi:hypothetical protein